MYEIGDFIEYINRESQICQHKIITKRVKHHLFRNDDTFYQVAVFNCIDKKSYAVFVPERQILRKVDVNK